MHVSLNRILSSQRIYIRPSLCLTFIMLLCGQMAAQQLSLSQSGNKCWNESSPSISDKSQDSAAPELMRARRLAACGKNQDAIAQYQQYLVAEPTQRAAWYELGEILQHAGQPAEAARAFQTVLRLDPGNKRAELGLAQAEAKLGNYDEALAFYDKVLSQSPDNYDALQGKAFVLYWTSHLLKAQAIFQHLTTVKPNDAENQDALRSIAHALDAERWAAIRPAENAPPQAWMGYYLSYLTSHPDDRAAIKSLARAEAQLGIYGEAIRYDRQALRLNPSDQAAREHLARVLSWDRQYAASIETYNELLRKNPANREARENLAKVYEWAGRLKEALSTEKQLLAADPANVQYQLDTARLELLTGDGHAAQKALAGLLCDHPHNRWARLQMAQLEIRQGHLSTALRDYDVALADNFNDPDALYGEARIYYFLGNPDRAYPLIIRALKERPKDFDILLLCARIERARHERKEALAFLRRASLLNPASAELQSLKAQMRDERRVTVHTSSAYARELSFQNPFVTTAGVPFPGRTVEDLNTYSSAIRTGFSLLPRTDSFVTLAATPSNSPFGGIQGAVAPAEFLYGQTTQLSRLITVRGGIGAVRLGPGETYHLGSLSTPVTTPGVVPVGYVGYSLFPTRKLSLDFAASRAAITYTPTSVRFGVIETSVQAGINYAFDSRTRLAVSYYHDRDSSSVYDQVDNAFGGAVILEKNGHDHGNGGALTFNRAVIRSDRFSLDMGYSGLAFSYVGARRGVFMGFFNPTFYQRHFFTSQVTGELAGPVKYTFIGDVGVQQANEGAPFTRAAEIGPGLTVRVNRTLSVILGYVHYNFAQSLGSVRGNAVQLETDWSF